MEGNFASRRMTIAARHLQESFIQVASPSFGSMETVRKILHGRGLEYATQPVRFHDNGRWLPRWSEWLVRPQRHWRLDTRSFLEGLISLGLNSELDKRVVVDAIYFMRRQPDLRVAINISADGLCSDELTDTLGSALDHHGVDGRNVFLEITEHRPIKSLEEAHRQAGRLMDLGIRLGMDHVGLRRQAATFALLEMNLLSYIKFGMGTLTRGYSTLVSGLLAAARDRNVDVIVTGIETSSQRAEILDLGVTGAQGYHWDIPEVEAIDFSGQDRQECA